MLFSAFLAGCSQKEAACDRAVKAALKNPKLYETLRIDEDPGEGKALDGYYVYFKYGKDVYNVDRGIAYCVYDNNSFKASADVLK
jgi:hypothetical protein